MMNLCAMKQPFKHWTIIFLKHLKSLEILFLKFLLLFNYSCMPFLPMEILLRTHSKLRKIYPRISTKSQ